jgi:hypothetical protein
MNMKKTYLVIAAIFLVLAIVAPTIIFEYNSSLNNSNIQVRNPNGQVTDGNTTIYKGFSAPPGISNVVPGVIALVLFALFGLFCYLGLKRT